MGSGWGRGGEGDGEGGLRGWPGAFRRQTDLFRFKMSQAGSVTDTHTHTHILSKREEGGRVRSEGGRNKAGKGGKTFLQG